MTPAPARLAQLQAVAERRLLAAAPGSQEHAMQALVLALVQLAGDGVESEIEMSSTKLSRALEVYTTGHGPASAEAVASIERLVRAEGAGFDVDKWRRICARIAGKRLKGRFDLVIQDYRRKPGAPRLSADQRAAYSAIEASARRGE